MPEKASTTLVQAVARLRADARRVRLRIMGAGALRQELAGQVAAQGLQAAVQPSGAQGQDDLPGLYAEATFSASPAGRRGSRGAHGGAKQRAAGPGDEDHWHPELVVDGETDLLVPPDDVGTLTEALRRLVHDEALRLRLGRAGRRRVLDEFSPIPMPPGS